MGQFRKTIIAARILLLMAMSAATPAAAATFDGEWNVQIASANYRLRQRRNRLDRDQQWPGRVDQRRLMTASGRVADAGNISVTLTSGIKRARRLRSPHRHIGIGHLARRALLRHLDRAADLTAACDTRARARVSIRPSRNIPRRSPAPSRSRNFRPAIPASRCGPCRWSARRRASAFRPAESTRRRRAVISRIGPPLVWTRPTPAMT